MSNIAPATLPVAVIGLGCFFPRATGVHAYWHLLYHGKDAIADIPASHWSPEDYFDADPNCKDHVYCRRGGFLSPVPFDPTEFGIPPSNLESTDSSQILGLMAAKAALTSAGYGGEADFDRDRTSVILGVTGTQELVIPLSSRLSWPKWKKALEDAQVDPAKARQVMDSLADEYVEWQENSFPGLLGNVVAGRICNRLDLNGTNCVVDAACASSMSAINLALLELYTGRSNMVVTGGVDTLNDIFMHMCFARTQILSATGDARPFSKNADGTVLGEGVGILILKRLADAERDGDRVLAVIKGIGASSDGKSQSIYAPRAEGQFKALRQAYDAASVAPPSVDLIEAHGTGTRVGDKIEVQALKMLFAEDGANPHCALGSVKSMIGHTKAAAGSAGLIKAVLALHHKVIPPTLKADPPDPELGLDDSPFYLSTAARPWFRRADQPRRAGVSAFGFGGSNFHMVLEEYRAERTVVSWDGSIEIIPLGAADRVALGQALDQAEKTLSAEDAPDALPHLAARLRAAFDPAAPHRLLMVLRRQEGDRGPAWNRETVWAEARQGLAENSDESVWFGRHSFYGQGAAPGPVAFLFPGQGSQYLKMGQDWVAWFPEALAALETAAAHFDGTEPLTDYIYPQVSPEATPALEEALRDTAVAQPAIGAVSVGMEKTLRRFGVTPAFTCGHSYGELTALYSAGWIDEATLYELSVLRGRLMAAAGGPEGASGGTMMAVKAPLDKLARLIETEGLDVVLANRNSPNQGVLSGSAAAIDQAEAACKANKFRTIRLPVAAAFHSRLMQDAQAPFAAALQDAEFNPGPIGVYANTTGQAYPTRPEEIRTILGDHLLNPVNFVDEVQNLYQAGVRIFVEVGPKTVLTGLVRQILKGQAFHALAADAGAGRSFGIEDLAVTLAKLTALGCPVKLDGWESRNGQTRRPKMQIPITGANYRNAKSRPRSTADAIRAVKDSPPSPRPQPEEPSEASYPSHAATGHEIEKPADRSDATGAQLSPSNQTTTTDMNPTDVDQDPQIQEAFNLVQQGLVSLQSLQQQTTAAHQKFLETQAQASRALQEMMASARHFAEHALGRTPSAVAAVPNRPENTVATGAPTPTARPTTTMPATHATTESALHAPLSGAPAALDITTQTAPEASGSLPAGQILRQVVSELTGYPDEMLSMSMDLESDLGIDSIKRVEILSTLEERLTRLPDASPEIMAGFRTLGEIADFLKGVPPPEATSAPPAPADTPADHPTPAIGSAVAQTLMTVVSELTGYPVDMLGLEMNVESDLGIDSIKRVEILSALEDRLPALPSVTPDEMAELKTLGQIAARLAPAQEAAATPPAPAPVPAPRPPGPSAAAEVMAVVGELTGYPTDMLAPEMDIASDLGIDSIKRVEILSALEDRLPGMRAVSPDEMAGLKTLGQIIAHLESDGHGSPVAESPQATAAPAPPSDEAPPSVRRHVLRAEAADIRKGARLDLPPRRRIFLTTDKSGLSHALADALEKEGLRTVQISPDILAHRETLPEACGLIVVGDAEADPPTDSQADFELAGHAFQLMHHLGPSLQASAGEGAAFLATITRMDGRHGLGADKFPHAIQGALTGMVKTAALEWEAVTCRGFDVSAEWQDNPRIAQTVVEALLYPSADSAVEIGLTADNAFRLEMTPQPLDGSGHPDLEDGDVVVVSGGGRGVTAAAVIELARFRRMTFVLLGRSPQPFDAPDWLNDLHDVQAIKRAIIANEFTNDDPTPQAVEASYRRQMCNRDIGATIAAVEAAGSTARYYEVDICDATKLEAVISDIRMVHGPVKALIHGAGILEDRLIVDKTPAQFTRVFDTKVKGLLNMMEATAEDPLRWIVLFSSVAARFGNVGQVDYAAANEALNKIAQSQSRQRPTCRIKSINWGPWDGGMVSAALKTAFRRRGIALLPVTAGTRALVAEMSAQADGAVEVVIGSERPAPLTHERRADLEDDPQPSAASGVHTAFQSEISLEQFPILDDHRLDGHPVVPLALIAEWMGHGALHNHPGMFLTGIDDLRLLKGIVLESEHPRRIRVLAAGTEPRADGLQIPLELHNGQNPETHVIHCKATALVSDRFGEPPTCKIPESLAGTNYPRVPADIYADILFHGDQLQGLRRVVANSPEGMRAEIATAPAPSRWIKNPARNHWIADPLIMDCAFQMASLWCYEHSGQVSLPSYFASYRQYCRRFPSTSLQAVLLVSEVSPHKMTGDFFFTDAEQTVLATIGGFQAVMDKRLMQAFKPGRPFAA